MNYHCKRREHWQPEKQADCKSCQQLKEKMPLKLATVEMAVKRYNGMNVRELQRQYLRALKESWSEPLNGKDFGGRWAIFEKHGLGKVESYYNGSALVPRFRWGWEFTSANDDFKILLKALRG